MDRKPEHEQPAKPALVSEEAWAAVPFEDRAAVLPLAGSMAMRGFEPDDAVAMGMALLRHGRLLERPQGKAVLRALSRAFGECMGDAVPRSIQMTAACEALLDILEAEDGVSQDPVKQAISIGAWATHGSCAACGEAVDIRDRAPGRLDLHRECLDPMRGIADAFRAAAAALGASRA